MLAPGTRHRREPRPKPLSEGELAPLPARTKTPATLLFPLTLYPLLRQGLRLRKRRRRGSSRPQTDMAAMMKSLMQVLQQHQPPSSSESSEEEVAEEVFEDPPLPPLPDLSPLDDDLALSPSEDEEAPNARCPPAQAEDPEPADRSVHPEETSYPDLLSHPPPLPDQELDLSSLNDILHRYLLPLPPLLPLIPITLTASSPLLIT